MQKSRIVIGATTRPCNRLPIDEALAHIAAAGYKHVALFRNRDGMAVDADTPPQEVDRVRRMAEDLGLTPSLVIGSLPQDAGDDAPAVDRYRRFLDNTARVGAQWALDCGCMNDSLRPVYVRRMQAAARHAAQVGVRITLKPHGGLGLTAEGLLETWRAVGHEAFTLCYDPGNILYYTAGKLHPEDDLPRIAPHVAVGIIKDCVVENGKPSVQVTAGDGLVDFPRVLRTLHEAEFTGPLYVECVGSDAYPAIDRDLAFTLGYVRGILEALT